MARKAQSSRNPGTLTWPPAQMRKIIKENGAPLLWPCPIRWLWLDGLQIIYLRFTGQHQNKFRSCEDAIIGMDPPDRGRRQLYASLLGKHPGGAQTTRGGRFL